MVRRGCSKGHRSIGTIVTIIGSRFTGKFASLQNTSLSLAYAREIKIKIASQDFTIYIMVQTGKSKIFQVVVSMVSH